MHLKENEMEKIKLEVSEQELILILNGLAKLPFELSHQLIAQYDALLKEHMKKEEK